MYAALLSNLVILVNKEKFIIENPFIILFIYTDTSCLSYEKLRLIISVIISAEANIAGKLINAILTRNEINIYIFAEQI